MKHPNYIDTKKLCEKYGGDKIIIGFFKSKSVVFTTYGVDGIQDIKAVKLAHKFNELAVREE